MKVNESTLSITVFDARLNPILTQDNPSEAFIADILSIGLNAKIDVFDADTNETLTMVYNYNTKQWDEVIVLNELNDAFERFLN